MKRTYVGPFHRFAYEQKGMDTVAVFDAEASMHLQPVAEFATAAEARAYIEAQIAADSSMRDDEEAA